MKFYNRERELAELQKLYKQAATQARMTVITGRRRVGKTSLALEFVKDHKHLYLFVSKKPETLLCMEFLENIRVRAVTVNDGVIFTVNDGRGTLSP